MFKYYTLPQLPERAVIENNVEVVIKKLDRMPDWSVATLRKANEIKIVHCVFSLEGAADQFYVLFKNPMYFSVLRDIMTVGANLNRDNHTRLDVCTNMDMNTVVLGPDDVRGCTGHNMLECLIKQVQRLEADQTPWYLLW